MNKTLTIMLGQKKHFINDKAFTDFIYPDDQDTFYFCRQTLVSQTNKESCELRIKTKNAKSFWVKLDCQSEKDSDKIDIAVSNISLLKKLENNLRLAASLFDECSDAIMVTDSELRVVKVNQAFKKNTGYLDKDILGRTPKILKPSNSNPFFYQQMQAELNQHHNWHGEVWNKHSDGKTHPEWLTISAIQNDSNDIIHYIGVFSDITQKKNKDAHIHFMAYYDPLTHLPNRALLKDRYDQTISLSHRNNHYGALIILDIDYFKVINDSLGHSIGDLLLQKVAQKLSSCLREQDTLSRFGGDEFVILLPELSQESKYASLLASRLTEKIMNNLCKELSVGEHKLQISASFGIAMFPTENDDFNNMLKLADNAMYQAKKSGRGRYHFFTKNLQQEADSRLRLQNNLRIAIEQQQFELYYQPQVNFSDNKAYGVEALIRWNHPQQGIISPADFIPVAEETGLIIPIGNWVIEQACLQIKQWNTNNLCDIKYIAVNVSIRQFQQKDFVTQVQETIAKNQINPTQLELELTESILIQNVTENQDKLDQLKKIGVRLAIDDFGTGYSSLQYLKCLPIDVIKIDQSFIRDIDNDKTGEAIIQTIIALAENLKLVVLAEGVENKRQLTFLKENGCQVYQGYYFSKPVKVSELSKLLNAQ